MPGRALEWRSACCGSWPTPAALAAWCLGLLCSAATLALLDLLRVLRGLITHTASLPALLQVAVPEFLYSLAWTPVIYLLFRAIFRRVGGTKLA